MKDFSAHIVKEDKGGKNGVRYYLQLASPNKSPTVSIQDGGIEVRELTPYGLFKVLEKNEGFVSFKFDNEFPEIGRNDIYSPELQIYHPEGPMWFVTERTDRNNHGDEHTERRLYMAQKYEGSLVERIVTDAIHQEIWGLRDGNAGRPQLDVKIRMVPRLQLREIIAEAEEKRLSSHIKFSPLRKRSMWVPK